MIIILTGGDISTGNSSMAEHEQLTLQCVPAWYPPGVKKENITTTYNWTVGGELQAHHEEFLSIENATRNDSGNYSCSFTMEYLLGNQTIRVTEASPPEDITIYCELIYPSISVFIYFKFWYPGRC